jgi:hypothetical protein
MPIDTQTFALSRWWAQAALASVRTNSSLFTSANLRTARRELIAGANQLKAIKNWLFAAQLIEQADKKYIVSRYGLCFLQNDREFRKSSSWWAFHLLVCFGKDPFPYDAFFLSLNPDVRQFSSFSQISKSISEQNTDAAANSIATYMEGILKMFRDDGPLMGLGLVEQKKEKTIAEEVSTEIYWRVGQASVPDSAILLAIALARSKHFAVRPSIDFGELLSIGAGHFLTLSQDQLRHRLRQLSSNDRWKSEIKFDDVANITSITFGQRFNPERMLIILMQDGVDSWT